MMKTLLAIIVVSLALCCYASAQEADPENGAMESNAAQLETNEPEAADTAPDQPPDITPYVRPALPEDYAQADEPALPAGATVVDVVVNNSDADLKKTFAANNGEPSIAVGPTKCGEIEASGCVVITAFSAPPGKTWEAMNAPLWLSKDKGDSWTFLKEAIPPPTGVDKKLLKNCPCDQTVEFERTYLVGTFLTLSAGNDRDIYSGSSPNLEKMEWKWEETNRGKADTTNQKNGAIDQPWLIQGPLTGKAADAPFYLYSGYQLGAQTRAAVADADPPPDFKKFNRDNQSGERKGGTGTNLGYRIAAAGPPNNPDPKRPNDIYSVYEADDGENAAKTAYKIRYYLNRSGNNGETWNLEGDLTQAAGKCTVNKDKTSTTGCLIAQVESTQGCSDYKVQENGKLGCGIPNAMKFGLVNALMGGVDAIAIDPKSYDIYVVYGARMKDRRTFNNHLFLARFTFNKGSLTFAQKPTDVTKAANAALPAVAVTTDQTVAVFYYSWDAVDGIIPVFSAHLRRSYNNGKTFEDKDEVLLLKKFLPATLPDPFIPLQRPYGDFMQLKALDNTFYGVFTANRDNFCTAAQGCKVATEDPIFYRVPSK